jgi:hypothetical protein
MRRATTEGDKGTSMTNQSSRAAFDSGDRSFIHSQETPMPKASAVFATAILLASAAIPGSAMSSGGAHGPSGMHAAPSPSGPNARPARNRALNSTSTARNPVPLKKKGKLNGPCYRSCVKTSMGSAFSTDQFCAHSCSLD